MNKRKRRKFRQDSLTVGSQYKKIFKSKEYMMTVIEKEGEILYKVNDRIFTSPSSAGKAITKYDVNGWVFWGIEK